MTRIGWIGTGVMGEPMARHLLDAGHQLTVTTRTRSRAETLEAAGARWAETPAEVASVSDVTFSIVGMPDDVRQVHLGADGTVGAAGPGHVLVDLTTSQPSLAVEIAEVAAARDVSALDAPVSGGDVGARAGTLSIMVGGPDGAFAAVEPLLAVLGTTVVHQGGPGAGQHTKMVNQTIIASTMVGVCEGLLYARRSGLDPSTVLTSVSGGAAGSWSLSNLAPRILDGDDEPGFFVDHFVKDLGIALAEAARMRLALPGLALAHQLYVALQAQGRGRNGTQALIHALDSLGGG